MKSCRRSRETMVALKRISYCRRPTAWLLVLVGLALGGCHQNPREMVCGTATLDGQPIVQGSVVFEPLENPGAPLSGSRITDGQFSMARSFGVWPGNYSVKVCAVRETGRTITDMGGKPLAEAGPVELQEDAGIPAIVIKGGPNRFDFQVHSKR